MKKWAFLIGISNYKKWTSYEFPDDVVKDLADFLKDSGGYKENSIICLKTNNPENKQPTTNIIKSNFMYLIDQLEKDERNQVLIYFVGHGSSFGREEECENYIIPMNAERLTIESIKETSIPIYNFFVKYLKRKGAKNWDVLFIIDACRAKQKIGLSTASSTFTEDLVKKKYPSGINLLLACAPGENSEIFRDKASKKEQGVFSYAFLKALKKDFQGPINTKELYFHLCDEVMKIATEYTVPIQRPYFDPEDLDSGGQKVFFEGKGVIKHQDKPKKISKGALILKTKSFWGKKVNLEDFGFLKELQKEIENPVKDFEIDKDGFVTSIDFSSIILINVPKSIFNFHYLNEVNFSDNSFDDDDKLKALENEGKVAKIDGEIYKQGQIKAKIENQQLVKQAEEFYNKKQWKKSSALIKKSKEVSNRYNWIDHVKHAEQLISIIEKRIEIEELTNQAKLNYDLGLWDNSIGLYKELKEISLELELHGSALRAEEMILQVKEKKRSSEEHKAIIREAKETKKLDGRTITSFRGVDIYLFEKYILQRIERSLDKKFELAGKEVLTYQFITPRFSVNKNRVSKIEINSCELGTLPKRIDRLESLEYLDLGFNKLEKLPDSICNLNLLQYLDLRNNKLIDLPKSIGELSSLKKLHLGNNYKLKQLPRSIGKLSQLKILILSSTNITSLPSWIKELPSINILGLNKNLLKRYPEMIMSIKSLKKIYLSEYSPPKLKLDKKTKSVVLKLKKRGIHVYPMSDYEQDEPKYLKSIDISQMASYKRKILNIGIIGPKSSGKSTFINYLKRDPSYTVISEEKESITICKRIYLVAFKLIEIKLDDKAKHILRDIHSIIYIWDSDPNSWDKNKDTLKELLKILGPQLWGPLERIPMTLLANKRDLDKVIPLAKIREILDTAKLQGVYIYETIATRGPNLKRAFTNLVRDTILNYNKEVS